MAPMPRMTSQARREHIIDAALEVFSRSGPNGTRTREIARQAGVSEALVFRHFRSKDELYQATLQRLIAQDTSIDSLLIPAAQHDDFGLLRAITLRLVGRVRSDPRMMRLSLLSALERVDVVTGRDRPPPEPVDNRLERMLGEYLRRRSAEGALSVSEPAVAARLYVAAILGYVMAQETGLRGPPLPASDNEVADTLASAFLLGLKPREPSRRRVDSKGKEDARCS